MSDPKPSSRIHPLVATAAVACTVLSLTSVAAITGLIPSSNSTTPAQITQTNDAQDRANQAQQEAYPKAS
ncbi:MAG: hypothetical protein NWQ13_02035, partial [Glaciimonas sp.]|nr:hypothetical protein [Glaciimonas sp.]